MTNATEDGTLAWTMAAGADRPTLHPGFDMEQYARESDRRMRTADSPSGLQRVDEDTMHVEAREDVDDEDTAHVYWACLGGAGSIPALVRPIGDLVGMPRAPAEGLVMSYLDGKRTVGQVIEASGLPTLVALSVLHGLLERGVISVREGA